jgi:hypothetical protein
MTQPREHGLTLRLCGGHYCIGASLARQGLRKHEAVQALRHAHLQ